ncbi:hypothetical protein EPUS_07147 [Endocarpon pusillum Z07020]|uniref:Maltose/galactoside acetyltransferase domain-containing protein n=1 Tax=Endocarpon pusillum (strain Z07020 / HMAS-L-300199) TaxID=1263415 RepID=U1HIL5_ENDPU|nr:uncharacterized protein EPUS_07147 [Endocarpon pusillum Z07020]ERF68729.1 hypothetical protein EPUS_07147 [Endocarpon pusillum Z07020]
MASTSKNHALMESVKSYKHVPWCDDYEKMISGMLYDSCVPELMNGRFRARKLMDKYNKYFPEDATFESLAKDREVMLKELMGSVGTDVFMEPPVYVDYGCNISIGERFYANFNTVILDCGIVTIGDRVMFGPFVSIFAATHETEVQSRRDNIEYARQVKIGDDCWVGGHVTILPGVTIGQGCTIGSNSIVTKDVPEWSVAMGSPAKVVKKVTPVPRIDKPEGDERSKYFPRNRYISRLQASGGGFNRAKIDHDEESYRRPTSVTTPQEPVCIAHEAGLLRALFRKFCSCSIIVILDGVLQANAYATISSSTLSSFVTPSQLQDDESYTPAENEQRRHAIPIIIIVVVVIIMTDTKSRQEEEEELPIHQSLVLYFTSREMVPDGSGVLKPMMVRKACIEGNCRAHDLEMILDILEEERRPPDTRPDDDSEKRDDHLRLAMFRDAVDLHMPLHRASFQPQADDAFTDEEKKRFPWIIDGTGS